MTKEQEYKKALIKITNTIIYFINAIDEVMKEMENV